MKPGMASAAAVRFRIGRHDTSWFARRTLLLVGLTSRLLGFAVVLLAWQVTLLLALLDGTIELGAYLIVHLLGSCALAVPFAWRANASAGNDRYAVALQMVVWSALAGPFGAFVAIALSLPSSIRLRKLRDSENDLVPADSPAIDPSERMHIALLDRRVRIEGASLIHPLMDVIAEGSQPAKLEALGVIYRKYEARLSAVLKRAFRDHDASVRVLAATVAAKLHAMFTSKIGKLQAAAAATPGLAQPWRNLAEARLAYAESGLLEATRARVQIESAVGDLSRVIELDPSDQASADRLETVKRQLFAGRE